MKKGTSKSMKGKEGERMRYVNEENYDVEVIN